MDKQCVDNGQVTCPNMMEFFHGLGVEVERSDMSLSVSFDEGKGYEWGSKNGFSSLFSQKMNLFNPYFYKMIREITKFKSDVIRYFILMMYIVPLNVPIHCSTFYIFI